MKKTIFHLNQLKEKKEPISWLVCYDFWTARAAEMAGIDLILIGDSLSNTVLGYESTNSVNTDDVLIFNKAVRRGALNTFLIGDCTSGSYESSDEQAINTAFRFVKESGVEAIKLEGGKRMAKRVRAIVNAGIPVIQHLGLLPQSLSALGGYRIQGKTLTSFESLCEDVEAAIWAGAFAVLLEGICEEVGEQITKNYGDKILILGIGAGSKLHGQLLLAADCLGTVGNLRPLFAKCYVPGAINDLQAEMKDVTDETAQKYGRETRLDGFFGLQIHAFKQYIKEVKEGSFPNKYYNYPLKPEELTILKTSKFWKD